MPTNLRLPSRLFARIPHTLSFVVAGVCAAALVGIQPVHAQIGKPEGLYYKSWAVIIGVENYLLAPPIPGAVNDAKTIAQALRQMGFDDVLEG